MNKRCRLKQIALVLILFLFLMASCSTPLSGILSFETPFPSPHSTAGESAGRGQAAWLAFVSDRRQRGNLDIWLFNLVTEQMEPLTSDEWQDAKPAWSPDGQNLAFLSFKIGGPTSIRVVNLSDRTVRFLVSPKRYRNVYDFAWSGDGRSIFYTIDTQTFESQIGQVDLRTGDCQYITHAESPISVSPDNQYLGVAVRKPEWLNHTVLRVLRLFDKTELQPTEEHFHPSIQAWAPQGNVLAVGSGTHPPQLGRIAIYEVSERKINLEAVDLLPAEPRMDICDLAWSPDGQRILAVRSLIVSNVCQGELLLYDANLRHYQVLPLAGLVSYGRWSEDGKWIVYSRDDTLNVFQYSTGVQKRASGEIWIAEPTGLNARPLITGSSYNGQPAWKPSNN